MSTYNLLIIGAGGFGREIHSWLWDCLPGEGYRLNGFLADKACEQEMNRLGTHWVGDPLNYQPQPNDRFVLAVGDLCARRKIVQAIESKRGEFVSVVHPTALVCPSAKIGRGAVIYPFAVVSHAAMLGDFVHLSLYASVGHDAKVGDNCYLSPYATLNGGAAIEHDVLLGTHASVAPLKRVGAHSRVSSGTALMQDAAARSLIFGVPGRVTPRMD